MEFLIVSGLSGAGKSRVVDILEDLDFYCVDNMPVALLPRFAELCLATRGRYERVALVTDIRERDGFSELFSALASLRDLGCEYRILFVEADTASIVKRYKESRRPHPLTQECSSIEEAIKRESELLAEVRDKASYIINTTDHTLGMLQSELYQLFEGEMQSRPLSVHVISFGFKYGIPMESDLLFDVRFLPNPFYVESLRSKTGLDEEVRDFIFKYEDTRQFIVHLNDMMAFLIPQYIEEGKHSLTVSIGCTGGHHRSVAIAEELAAFVRGRGQSARVTHRDMEKS